MAPHRAGVLFFLGIASLLLSGVGMLCSLTAVLTGIGLAAFIPPVCLGCYVCDAGKADLERMDSGAMDATGRQFTSIGQLCGRIAFWASLVVFLMLFAALVVIRAKAAY